MTKGKQNERKEVITVRYMTIPSPLTELKTAQGRDQGDAHFIMLPSREVAGEPSSDCCESSASQPSEVKRVRQVCVDWAGKHETRC